MSLFQREIKVSPAEPLTGSWTNLAAIFTLAVVAAIALSTFKDYGIGWDSRVQATYGQKLVSFYLSGFQDRSAFTYSDLRFYGGFFDILAALLNRISPFGEYETRHLLGAEFFLCGLFGAWRLTALLAGARAALIATLALATTPLLYGHAFINPKDSPFAWLLVWVMYFGCRILQSGRSAPAHVYLGFAVALGLALGTRVFAFAYVGYLAAVMLAAALSDRSDAGFGLRPLVRVACLLPLAIAIMFAFWPWAALGSANFFNSVDTFLHFPHRVPVLWEGETLQSTAPPGSYLLVLLGVQLPEYLLAGLATVATLALVKVRRLDLGDPHTRMMCFLMAAVATPLVAFLVLRPTVYNGLRQFLFIVPPLVILGAIGVDRLLTLCERRKVALYAATAFLAFALLREVAIMTVLHPYEYVAFNDFTGRLAGAVGRFELDYWGTSLGEASRELARLTQSAAAKGSRKLKVFVCGDRMSAEYYLPKDYQIAATWEEADFIVAPMEQTCRGVLKRSPKILAEVRRAGAVLSRVFDLRPAEAAPPLARAATPIP